jgi:hypothetical protein
MESPSGYLSFMRRVRRGAILFQVLWLAASGLSGWALVSPGRRYLAIPGLSAAVLFVLAGTLVRRRYSSALKVAQNPQLVYWAHPIDRTGHIASNSLDDCRDLSLHLRDGRQFEVDLPSQDMRSFVAWLKEQNPSVRLGSYDGRDSTTEAERS